MGIFRKATRLGSRVAKNAARQIVMPEDEKSKKSKGDKSAEPAAPQHSDAEYDELQEKGMPADFEDILKNVEERDYIDTHRETSPLRQAEDAIVLDNSQLTIPQQKAWLMEQYQKAIKA